MRGLYGLLAAAAVLVTAVAAFDRNALPPSSPRKTVNFGPDPPTRSAFGGVSAEDAAALAELNAEVGRRLAADRARWVERARARRQRLVSGGEPGLVPGMPVDAIEGTAESEDWSYGIRNPEITGGYVAQTFLEVLAGEPTDPECRARRRSATFFEQTGGHVSGHSSIGHYYFSQIAVGSGNQYDPVANAVASVHVDVDPKSPTFRHVVAYSKSLHESQTSDEPDEPMNASAPRASSNWHHLAELQVERDRRISAWRESCELAVRDLVEKAGAGEWSRSAAGQRVLRLGDAPGFDQAAADDLSPAEARAAACVKGEVPDHLTAVDINATKAIVDPRLALLSFLSVVGDSRVQAHLASAEPEDILDDMVLSAPYESEDLPEYEFSFEQQRPQLRIKNVPGSAVVDRRPEGVPVATRLESLSVPRPRADGIVNETDRVSQLVWGFEYRTDMNWYHGHVDATRPGLIVSSVDWVKDFRPPGDVDPTEHAGAMAALRETLGSRTYAELYPKPERKRRGTREPQPAHPLNATYKVFPWSTNDPSEGEREVIRAPHHPLASPQGWHRIPSEVENQPTVWTKLPSESDKWMHEPGWSQRTRRGMNLTDTRGNNVFAQENWEGFSRWENNGRPDGSHNLTFEFGLHWGPRDNMTGKHIDPKSYINASVTELFYTCNELHDLFYLYGFDEAAGNFQQHNFGHEGLGDDAVIANAQDGSGYNNANFATPPDGQHGQMRMYVWNGAHPWRDGDLEAGIVAHEALHGVSTRLTGGPANSGCLAWGESGGMGEGWGDFVATLIRMHKKKPQDFTMGEWASRMKGGIRKYKYSLNHTTEPETYKVLDGPSYFGVHAIGEVWAEMLYTVAEALIQKHGFEHSLFPPADADARDRFYVQSEKTGRRHPRKGNTLVLQLVVDGMKLQPCRPKFVDARDAIIQADAILTGGDNGCDIWQAFASRGLGPKAELRGSTPWGGGIREEDYSVPKECRKNME